MSKLWKNCWQSGVNILYMATYLKHGDMKKKSSPSTAYEQGKYFVYFKSKQFGLVLVNQWMLIMQSTSNLHRDVYSYRPVPRLMGMRVRHPTSYPLWVVALLRLGRVTHLENLHREYELKVVIISTQCLTSWASKGLAILVQWPPPGSDYLSSVAQSRVSLYPFTQAPGVVLPLHYLVSAKLVCFCYISLHVSGNLSSFKGKISSLCYPSGLWYLPQT